MAYDSQLVCWEFGVVHVSKLSFAPDGLNDLIDEQFPECRIVPPLPGLSLQNTVKDVDRRADTLDQLNLNSENVLLVQHGNARHILFFAARTGA